MKLSNQNINLVIVNFLEVLASVDFDFEKYYLKPANDKIFNKFIEEKLETRLFVTDLLESLLTFDVKIVALIDGDLSTYTKRLKRLGIIHYFASIEVRDRCELARQ